jgi:DsbC/DsbD-like thiol-disulfide interchange protein
MDAELLVETVAPKPGSVVLVGFRFRPKPGWHGYWSNPGDSGITPTVRWEAPAGITFGPLLHPAPTLLTADGISSFVHQGPNVLLSRMTVGRSVPPRTPISVRAHLSWAACTATQCVPLRATFTLDLVAGNGARGPDASVLQAAASKLPRPASGVTFAVAANRLRLRLPSSLHLNGKRARFFPDQTRDFDVRSARPATNQEFVVIGAELNGEPPVSLTGVVSDGERSYRVKAVRTPESDPADEAETEQAIVPEVAKPPSSDASNDVRIPGPEAGAAAHSPRPEPNPRNWLWLLAAAGMIVAGGWLWSRRR